MPFSKVLRRPKYLTKRSSRLLRAMRQDWEKLHAGGKSLLMQSVFQFCLFLKTRLQVGISRLT